jgi:hypothetical protein
VRYHFSAAEPPCVVNVESFEPLPDTSRPLKPAPTRALASSAVWLS